MRWNPSTKMVQVCDGGTWYDKEYYDPQWDGFYYNYGNYKSEIFMPTANTYNCTFENNAANLNFKSPVGNGGWNCGQMKILSPIHLDSRPCFIKVTFRQTKTSGYGDVQGQIGLATSINIAQANQNRSITDALVIQSINWNTQTTDSGLKEVTLDCRQYADRDLYFAVAMSAPYVNGAVANCTIYTIQKIYE